MVKLFKGCLSQIACNYFEEQATSAAAADADRFRRGRECKSDSDYVIFDVENIKAQIDLFGTDRIFRLLNCLISCSVDDIVHTSNQYCSVRMNE